ncbi:FAD-dependent oxidoreductase [Azotobacter sp. CWF10]
MKIVIIGNGPAAISAAETLRGQDRSCEIVMLSRESVPFYSPCPLAEYVEGSVPRTISSCATRTSTPAPESTSATAARCVGSTRRPVRSGPGTRPSATTSC